MIQVNPLSLECSNHSVSSDSKKGSLNGRSAVLIVPSEHGVNAFKAGAGGIGGLEGLGFWVAVILGGLVTTIATVAVGAATSLDLAKTGITFGVTATTSVVGACVLKRCYKGA